MKSILRMRTYLPVLLFSLFFIHYVSAKDWTNQEYLIDGVYYLVCQKDLNMAEDQFHKVILSSSFNSLSEETESVDHDKRIVAEAFYFLGKIYCNKAVSQANVTEDMNYYLSQAKGYLIKAEEYGIIYDQLHPPLLNEIDEKYPNVKASIPKSTNDKTKVSIKMSDDLYQIKSIGIDQNATVTKNNFITDKESTLECGTIYKMKPDNQMAIRSAYKVMIIALIGLSIWLMRN